MSGNFLKDKVFFLFAIKSLINHNLDYFLEKLQIVVKKTIRNNLMQLDSGNINCKIDTLKESWHSYVCALKIVITQTVCLVDFFEYM